jgi:predicted transposase YdaD
MRKTTKKKKTTRKRIYTAPRDKEHDALTKVALSHKESVEGLLQTELPSEVYEGLVLSTLERISDSYTNENLKNAYADKAFTCKTKEGETVLIAFLVEHKSYVPTEPIYV